MSHMWLVIVPLVVSSLAAAALGHAQPAPAPVSSIDAAMADAERHLQSGDLAAAQRSYRGAIREGRLLLSAVAAVDGRVPDAVHELEAARASAPDDLELAFAVASGYLRVKRVDEAERLFAELAKAKPIPQTYVLIGRAYRDASEFDRARTALETALSMDARVKRAHYYLGTIAVLADGVVRLDEAIAQFKQELTLAPDDPVTNLKLGMALVEAKEPAAALPSLEIAARAEPPFVDAFQYLGRGQAALGRPKEAVASFRHALDLSKGLARDEERIGHIHYQLALALRTLGDTKEASIHFDAAKRSSAVRAENARERLARYLGSDTSGPADPGAPASKTGVAALTAAQRAELTRRTRTALARAHFNLGVIEAQRERFAQAADLFQQAATLDPDLPQVQYSLGVALFNLHQYDKAIAPLSHVLTTAAPPQQATMVRRMLALSLLNTDAYDKAADLLKDDPGRDADPALLYAYGVALVRSNRAADAETIFSQLLTRYRDRPDISVVLGMAYGQQGDYDAAVEALQRAIALKADIADAHATLGFIYLKQGRLPEAATELRAELASHPENAQARHHLATVLDMQGQQPEAVTLLRALLASKPDYADAQYLLGKILLAQGAAAEAVDHLEAATRLNPDEPSAHYQLAQAYQKLGRDRLAQEQFERFRRLKDKRRDRTP